MDTKITRFETAISSSYLPHWGNVEVAKEFVQNAVYTKTILGDDIELGYSNNKAIIHNDPSGFEKGKLLVGESGQRGVEGAPGEYGEGVLMALCVGVRNGLNISIQTNGFLVEPAIEPSSIDPEVSVLVLYINDNDLFGGTTVTIEGISKEDFEEAKSYFAILRGISFESVSTDGILRSEGGETNPVYVNGVVITEIPSVFSYNFTDTSLMNRDRSSVDMYRVKQQVRKRLASIEDVEVAKMVLKNIIEDDTLLESQSGIDSMSANDKIWKEAITELYGSKVALATGGASDTKARYRGFKLIPSLPLSWEAYFNYSLEIHSSSELYKMGEVAKRTHKKPSPEESAILGWCKRLIKLYYGDYGTVKVCADLRDEYDNKCDGLYDPKADVIWLSKNILMSKENTFKTLLHETVHRVTGADDNTEAFTRGFEDACFGILMRGSSK